MIEITINNSFSKIEGLNVAQFKELSKLLSYTVGGSSSYFSKFGPKRKSLLDKKGYFPTGLLNKVIKQYKNAVIIDNRIKPKKQLGMFKISL